MNESAEQTAPAIQLPSDCAASLLALADDELVIGHRHSEWLGLSPFLEEDLTLSSIAQDEFGHARGLYALLWPEWDDRDAGVTRRPASDWRSCAITELPGQPWELSLVRHFLYDLSEPFRWRGIVEQFGDVVPGLADLANTVIAEERFHERHATDLVERLAQADEGRTRLNIQLAALTPLTTGLSSGMTNAGWATFISTTNGWLNEAKLDPISFLITPLAEDRMVRSPGFASIHSQLIEVVNFDPSARW
jgi:ring-1,2-phenylacetyl-CoA epoxidase subunit PaaC